MIKKTAKKQRTKKLVAVKNKKPKDPLKEREKIFKKQRKERGFDDSETWSLTDTVANFIIPRLERYEEIAKETLVRDGKLIKDIDCFLNSMKLISRRGTWTNEEEKSYMMD